MTNPTAGFLAWIERLTGLHIHWHRAWDTHPNRRSYSGVDAATSSGAASNHPQSAPTALHQKERT